MPERREAEARRRQEAETASTTAEGSETIMGAGEVPECPMTPGAYGPRTPSPDRGYLHGAEAGSDAQPHGPNCQRLQRRKMI